MLQVSDTHLGPGVPMADEHWAAVIAHVQRTGPDLVVHTGDVTLDGVRDPAQLAYARARLHQLPAPWRAVPGNHDIGDVDDPARLIDAERIDAFAAGFGPPNWVHEEDGWQLIGLDIQSLQASADGGPRWLWDALAADIPTALFIHRPLRPWGVQVDSPGRYVYEPWRSRLMTAIADGNVRLVASGHVHQFLDHLDGDVRHVWAPSSWAAIPDTLQEQIGQKWVGVVEYQFGADGSLDVDFVRPSGISDVISGIDFPAPY